MKAKLTFNLPEESQEFADAINGRRWSLAVWEFKDYLRTKIKYSELSDQDYDALEKASEQLHEILNSNNLTFDEK